MKLRDLKRVRIKVKGIVQGVGFRPTVYKHAINNGVFGFVMNTPEGVTIEAEGPSHLVDAFIKDVVESPPRISRVTDVDIKSIDPEGDLDFKIITSIAVGSKNVEISPDIAICKDCEREILDTKNRRYLYPFTNCTNCGPRFTIVKDRPYDRKNTSMSEFVMCSDCLSEYKDPLDRRFHAQPNACPKCGPKVFLLGKNKANKDPINETCKALIDGKLVGIKSLGGFNIACNALDNEVVERLRDKKKRGTKAFALMVKDIDTIRKYCWINEKEEKILLSRVAPIVLLKKKELSLDHISKDNNYLGVMLPYTPLHKILFRDLEVLVMTSANRADEPIATRDNEMSELMKEGFVDMVLSNDRDIINRCDDSIVQVVDGAVFVIRRARGLVPSGIRIKGTNDHNSMSMGADLKNTFALKKGHTVYLSQHIGDLEDQRNIDYQREQIEEFIRIIEVEPSFKNIDAHPNYANFNSSDKKVFHHHAHALSVMAENDLLGQEVLGIICDGTGYGTDGNIWGFEFLKVLKDYSKFERIFHLDYFALPGGDKASHELDRLAVSLTEHLGGIDIPGLSKKRADIIKALIRSDINCPMCSSLGRLFDGVACLCGISTIASYEAQAAIMLQKYAEGFKGQVREPYPSTIKANKVDYRPMIEKLVLDINSGVGKEELAYKFHLWVVDSIIEVINRTTPGKVAFSGGCFQNSLLVSMLNMRLKGYSNMDIYFNNDIPTNDAGISFGQSVI